MKLNNCKFFITLACIAAFTGFAQAENIEVGTRSPSEEERTLVAIQRALHEEKEATETPVKKAFSSKKFYEQHYAAFHRILAAAIDGSTIELDDGSIWGLKYVSDWSVVLNWLPRDSIIIEQNGYSGDEYKIVNQALNQSVVATLNLGPLYQGNHTHWVVTKDSFWGSVKLDDGSEWVPYFSSDTKNWRPDDTVIVGSYDSFGSYNTVLINVNLLDCARFKLDNKKN